MKRIFVFGSNLAGVHGAGSALCAKNSWGAQPGVGVGRTGNAYAIPTKDATIQRSLPLKEITQHVNEFIRYARAHPNLQFHIVAIGCGLAGYVPAQIAPFFKKAPGNCILPDSFLELLP